ncbi:sterol O-acyltransferase 1 [Phymastichus coffea]|uniref:sterol O-acyltransferase 1 n=1 Tax=Phymastichus coffea TaxID=108790 RepID=UPI00273CF14C|nr:sterol O-acyltransferase 1 [Phymastichus coffea]
MNGNVVSVRSRHENGDSSRLHEVNGGPLHAFQPSEGTVSLDQMNIKHLENRMQVLRQSLVDDIDAQLNSMMSEVIERLQESNPKQNGYHKGASDHKQERKGGEKQFIPRNSYLTDLFKVNHIRTIYNIFAAMLLVLFLNTVVHDYIQTGTTHVGLRTIKTGFGSVYDIVEIWMIMVASTFFIYLEFSLWANKHNELAPKSISRKIWDYASLFVFITHQTLFIMVPAKLTIDKHFPAAAGILVLMEQVRMLMKTHAFVRSNVPRVLAYKPKDENSEASFYPQFSKFLYFMFAPTFIYRDEYPRTKSIRWKVVMWNVAEILMIVFYVAFILERFIIPPFEKYGPRIFEIQFVVLTVFSSMLPAIVMFLFGFYCILHACQNAMAELLRFADRQFYKDWWNCTSFSAFYRTWNIPVHDWLHEYIYKDVHVKCHSKVFAIAMTFAVSALFHEYILALAFGFFYPVLFISFAGFSLLLVFLMKNYSKMDGNIYMWLALIVGNGIVYTLYPMEFYARSNCPPYSDHLLDSILPRSWICHKISNDTSSVN